MTIEKINWNEKIDEAKRLYESGFSLNQISKHFGVYHGGLAKALEKAGVTLRPRYQTGPRNSLQLPSSRRSPRSMSALASGASIDQAERIHWREVNIAGLTNELGKATDEERRQSLRCRIQEEKDDIERIMSEGKTPNTETVAALKEAEAGGGEVFHGTTEELFEKIVAEDESEDHPPAPPQSP